LAAPFAFSAAAAAGLAASSFAAAAGFAAAAFAAGFSGFFSGTFDSIPSPVLPTSTSPAAVNLSNSASPLPPAG
jgi:hypothetical protein